MKKMLFLTLCSLIWLTGLGFAEIPQTINFQGRLTNANGEPLNDGNYSITVSLYPLPENNPKHLWSEVIKVKTKNGYFNIILGVNKINNPLKEEWFNQQLYVGIKVETDPEMEPLQPLNSVPYAMSAMNGVPVGTIMAWHKSMAGTPMLPPQWMECNGQPITDTESPYKGKVLPNLNGASEGEPIPGIDGKPPVFLRGGLTSGDGQMDALQFHVHKCLAWWPSDSSGSGYAPGINYIYQKSQTWPSQGPATEFGAKCDDHETRPVNMAVVWIMKVK